MTGIRVFVYGTLKRGQPNHFYLDETSGRTKKGICKFMVKAQTLDKYPLVVATRFNVPFLLAARGIGKNVIGEVYEVDDECFQSLDELEEYPKVYGRELINVRLLEHSGNGASCGDTIQCWCYFLYNFKPEILNLPYHEEYDDSKRPEDARYDEISAPDNSHWKEVRTDYAG
ncbi:hypothetical protein CHS0354_019671 [Potamilus streckersoni]|uniref:Gamma-glutamylcyclotransferase family protein n=1 Tax=Potamilus streckersoni TaxID=2493646 RepID=A0AAE0T907_9BIVA|nr:hypothetical protein CHS0354_019671 [Potamilus streckersoni]